MNHSSAEARRSRAEAAAVGVAVGAAFGGAVTAHPDPLRRLVGPRRPPATPWPHFPDNLTQRVADLAAGTDTGGALPTAALIGAYFADDLGQAAQHATHGRTDEDAAAALAVTLAAAWAYRLQIGAAPGFASLLDLVLTGLAESTTFEALLRANRLSPATPPQLAAQVLGNGGAPENTVPLALWCASSYLSNAEHALWLAVAGGGDSAVIAAITGAVVVMASGVSHIPPGWRTAAGA